MNNNGQSLIETILVLPLLILSMAGVILFFGYSFIFFYTNYHLHEATFCRLSYSEKYCESILIKNIKWVRYISIHKLTLTKNKDKTVGKIILNIPVPTITDKFNIKFNKMELKKEALNSVWI